MRLNIMRLTSDGVPRLNCAASVLSSRPMVNASDLSDGRPFPIAPTNKDSEYRRYMTRSLVSYSEIILSSKLETISTGPIQPHQDQLGKPTRRP